MPRGASPRDGQPLTKRRAVIARLVAGERSEVSGITATQNTVHVSDPDVGRHDFSLDEVLPEGSSQERLYRAAVGPLLEETMAGADTACLMYGSSLTGKLGVFLGRGNANSSFSKRDDSLVARAARSALNSAERLRDAMGSQLSFAISVAEVHGEKVHDLLVAVSRTPSSGALATVDEEPTAAASNQAESVVSMEGSVASMPSLTSGIAHEQEHREPTEQEISMYNKSVVSLELQEGKFVAEGLTTRQFSSEVEALAMVDAAVDFRNCCSHLDLEGTHTVVTIYCTRKDKNSASPDPVLSCMHLVNLAATESFNSRTVDSKEAARVELALKSLSKVLAGGPGVSIAVGSCGLTEFLSSALTGTAHTRLVANVLSSPAALAAAMETLGYAKKSVAVELRTPVSAGVNPDYVVVDHEGVVQDLKREIGQLQQDLRAQHSHYTQLLQKHAPHALPRGPVERDGAFDSGSEALTDDEEAEVEEEPSSGSAAAIAAMSTTMATVKSAKTMRGASTARATQRANEAKIRELEEHLERQKYRNNSLEEQVGHLREQLTEVKEKRMQSDHLHYKQSKKLTEQVKLTREHAKAQEEQMQFDVHKEREAAQGVQTSLKQQNDSLRHDFNTLMGSIPRFMEKRTKEVADERGMRETIKSQAHEELKAMVSAAEANAVRQVSNLKSQSEFLLQRKAQEIKSLNDVHQEYVDQACAREASLSQELDYLYEYTNRLARIIERVEAGKYSIRSLRGTKAYQIPGHEKPVPLNMDRLLYITSKLRQTEKFETLDGTEPPTPQGLNDADNDVMGSPEAESVATTVKAEKPSVESLSEAFKDQLRAQVMDELAQSETVQYIRGLEMDVRQYRKELQIERKSVNDLRIAVNSAQRTPAPQALPPFDKFNRDASRKSVSSSSAVPYPEKWGNPMGTSISSNITGARPGTAPEHLRSLRRPDSSPKALDSPTGYRPTTTGRAKFGYRNSMHSSPSGSPMARSSSLRRSG